MRRLLTRRGRRGWCILAVLGLFLLPAMPALAQTNPFTGAPAAREAPAEVVPVGLWTQLGRQVVKVQREMNMRLSRQMRAIRNGGSAAALVVGLALAFLYGAFHVAGPGHGKAVIVSYFLGREAKLTRGLLLGAQIAVTHVIAAIVLVWLADIALRQSLGTTPAEMRWVQMLSYGAILVIGLHMLWQAVRQWRGGTASSCGHDHGAGHHHHGHHEPGASGSQERGGGAQQGVLSFGVGVVPCTGATLAMLYALANDIVFAGILMVVAIGTGMAITMAVIGIATIAARRLILMRSAPSASGGRLASLLHLCAGLGITLLAAAMLYGASLPGL